MKDSLDLFWKDLKFMTDILINILILVVLSGHFGTELTVLWHKIVMFLILLIGLVIQLEKIFTWSPQNKPHTLPR